MKINFLFILFLLFVAEESKPETSKWGKLELEQTKRGGSATQGFTTTKTVRIGTGTVPVRRCLKLGKYWFGSDTKKESKSRSATHQ